MSDMINAFLFAMMLDAHPFQSGCMTSRRVSLCDKGVFVLPWRITHDLRTSGAGHAVHHSNANKKKKLCAGIQECAMFTPIADKFKGHRSFLR